MVATNTVTSYCVARGDQIQQLIKFTLQTYGLCDKVYTVYMIHFYPLNASLQRFVHFIYI